ncbi:DUF5753 domain-containing protein [Streptomyces phaeochromogenes]|uniref:DUF5753 domain-containing protein n=1 Tax=Streptomyces phaeochromogenes TaxID=1923 RepID=UPI003716BAB8
MRWKREEVGLTLEGTVEGSFYAPTYLSEIERGQRRMPEDLAHHVDRVLKTDGFFGRRCEDVRKAKGKGHAGYFERILDAEKHAKTIEEWCRTLVPGLLQAPAYARAVVRATHPLAPDDEVEEKTNARMARAQLFEDDHTMLGTAKIMTFPDAPPLAYTESLHSGDTIDDPALVEEYRRSYDLLRAAALPPEASLAMIEDAAEDYRNGKQAD